MLVFSVSMHVKVAETKLRMELTSTRHFGTSRWDSTKGRNNRSFLWLNARRFRSSSAEAFYSRPGLCHSLQHTELKVSISHVCCSTFPWRLTNLPEECWLHSPKLYKVPGGKTLDFERLQKKRISLTSSFRDQIILFHPFGEVMNGICFKLSYKLVSSIELNYC